MANLDTTEAELLDIQRRTLEDIHNHADKVRSVLLHGTAEKKQQFITDLGVLNICGKCELAFFKALLYRITIPKAMTMAALQQPLYERTTYAVPFQYASPKTFFSSMYVAKTRLLADATGESRMDMYQAARDKMWKEFTPNEAAPPAHIFQAASIPYWCFTIYRTQVGEGKPRGYFPEAPAIKREPTAFTLTDIGEELGFKDPPRHILATKPCARKVVQIFTEEDLEDD